MTVSPAALDAHHKIPAALVQRELRMALCQTISLY